VGKVFNKIIVVGNLTRDIELRYTQGGTAIAKTAIATSRKFTSNGEKKEETCFVDITFFGRSGEVANQYLRKGSKILVEGRLNFEQWVDQNGQKRSKHSVIAETMQMLDSRVDSGHNAPTRDSTTQDMRQNTHPNHNYNSRYDEAPQQQQQQQSKPYDMNAVPTAHENISGQGNAQAKQTPSPDSVPAIDVEDGEIPF